MNLRSLSPNPTQNQIKVSCLNAVPSSIAILTAMGQKVSETNAARNETVFDVSDLAQGVYFVVLQFGNETIIKKFAKMN